VKITWISYFILALADCVVYMKWGRKLLLLPLSPVVSWSVWSGFNEPNELCLFPFSWSIGNCSLLPLEPETWFAFAGDLLPTDTLEPTDSTLCPLLDPVLLILFSLGFTETSLEIQELSYSFSVKLVKTTWNPAEQSQFVLNRSDAFSRAQQNALWSFQTSLNQQYFHGSC